MPPACREAQGLVCYDFEGGSVFALPLVEGLSAASTPRTAAADAAAAQAGTPSTAASQLPQQPQQQPQQLRCIGAVLLSFPPAQAGAQQSPGALDVGHARNLQLLAAALAPGVAAAAAPLLSHCNLLLGVQAAERLVEGQEEGEDMGSDVSVELTDLEEEEEGWEQGEGLAALGGGSEGSHEGAAGAAAEAEGEQAPALVLPWAAGSCRGSSDKPPEDPGASSAAVLASPLQHESEGEPSGHGGTRQRAQQAQRAPLPPPESPAAASSTAAGPYLAGTSSGPQSSLGSLHTACSWGSEQHPPAKVLPRSSEEGDSPQGAGGVPLERLAGATWHRLLRFADPRLEACFAARLAGERWKVSRSVSQ